MDVLQTLEKMIQDSSMNEEDKAEAIELFSTVSADDLVVYLETVTEKPEMLQWYVENYRKKKIAMRTGNSALWDEILDEEIKMLQD